MTVKRVVNHSGPQTADSHQHLSQSVAADCVSQNSKFLLPTGVSERLTSMETHVKLSAGK